MPSVGLKYVVSFSSQDDKHPVANLITSDGYKKWLSHPQEKSQAIEAVVQLDHLCQISYLDIGSIWCATIEVQVGRSDWPAGREFQTLVYTVSLMTPTDCNLGKNPTKTQMFSSDLFCPEVAKHQWDRLKLICKQPYKKHTQFGLSFIRVRTSGSTPGDKKETGNIQQTASVKSIQNHFFGKMANGLSSPQENLKIKLLKIAGTAENGAEHDGSLSRTAKLVLAASETKPQIFSPEVKSPVTENRGMYSSHMEQKYRPKFEDEAMEFFSNLTIKESELDKILIADLRHSFERKQRRKLTKEEKKIFRDMAEQFISDRFGPKTEENKKNMKSGLSNVKKLTFAPNKLNAPATSYQIISSNNMQISKPREKQGPESTVSVNQQNVDPVVSCPPLKRKLDANEATSPATKIRKAETLLQKLKSLEYTKPFTERTNFEPLRNKVEKLVSMTSESNPSRGVFFYKGIRVGEDPDTGVGDTKGAFRKTENVLETPCAAVSPNSGQNFSILSSDESLPDISSELEYENENFKNRSGCGNGVRARRGGSRRGKDSRGSASQNRASLIDNVVSLIEDDLDVIDRNMDCSSPQGSTRGRGRGRGRGSGRGRGRKKNNTSPAVAVGETISGPPPDSPPRIPRGFTKCTGCNDVFGEMLIAAHHLRCSSYKAKQSSGSPGQTTGDMIQPTSSTPMKLSATPSGCSATLTNSSSFTGSPSTGSSSSPRGRGRGRGEGRGRARGRKTPNATGYTECEGCHDLFGNMMIERHKERCTPYQLRLIDEEENLDTLPCTPCGSPGYSDVAATSSPRGRVRGRRVGRGRRKKVSSIASLEVRPTGFAKCDGCNQYFGENLLSAHQDRCQSMRNRQKPSSESPWLCAQPSDKISTPPPTKSSVMRASAVSVRNDPSSSSLRVDSSAQSGNQPKSPPWLLAAERRLKEQRLLQQSTAVLNVTESSDLTFCMDSYNGSVLSVRNGASNGTSDRQAFLDAQARQLEKYRAIAEMSPSECSTASSAGNLNRKGRDKRRINRSVDLTVESDSDDDDYNEAEDYDDDLDGFIVNDDDEIDDHVDFNPDISSQDVDDDGSSDEETEELVERNILVECPLCGEYFPDSIIQVHAATCYL